VQAFSLVRICIFGEVARDENEAARPAEIAFCL
jgi:hypothetical protein